MKRTFWNVGLSLPIVGCAHHKPDNKGLSEIEIGVWQAREFEHPLNIHFVAVIEHDCSEFIADVE